MNFPKEKRMKMNLTSTSKFVSLILRHKPETIGIQLDEHGWANVDGLIAGISKTRKFNREILEEIVRTDNKQRFTFNEDKTKIRANQGHSIPVDVELPAAIPPETLWHGTGEKYVASIDQQGLIPKGRLYVHLSSDAATATKVGSQQSIRCVQQWKLSMDFLKSTAGFRKYGEVSMISVSFLIAP